MSLFWPRATLKGPKRSFVVVILDVLLLGVKTWLKNVPNWTKMCFCGKSWYWIAVFALYGLMWPYMPLCGLVWPYVASYGLDVAFHGHEYVWPQLKWYGLVWPSMALYGLAWPCMAFYGLLWPCIAFDGLLWPLWSFIAFYGPLLPFMALCGLLWQNIVVSRGIKSKFIWSCWFRPDHPQLWEIDRREVREIRFFCKNRAPPSHSNFLSL